MPVPGRNNLALAMRLIRPQTVTVHAYAGRALNPAGQYVPTFEPPRTVTGGSVQPVPRDRYERLGMEAAKDYVQWWAPAKLYGVDRNGAPDELEWGGRRFQVTRVTDWHAQDGWVVVTAVRLDPTRPTTEG